MYVCQVPVLISLVVIYYVHSSGALYTMRLIYVHVSGTL